MGKANFCYAGWRSAHFVLGGFFMPYMFLIKNLEMRVLLQRPQ